MKEQFDISEIIDMGIEKERKRYQYYDSLAGKFTDKKVNHLFSQLRDWEAAHVAKITEFKKAIDASSLVEYETGTLSSYFRLLVDHRLDEQPTEAELLSVISSPYEALTYALTFEKDAVLFFSELLLCVEDTHKELIQSLLDEEKNHIVYLLELRESL